MKVRATWKDPDFSVLYRRKWADFDSLPTDVQARLMELGAGEYLTVEFDLDTGRTEVLPD